MLRWPQASNSHTPFHSGALASKITEENLLFILKRTTLRSWKYQEAFINYFISTFHFASLKASASKDSFPSSKGQTVLFFGKGPRHDAVSCWFPKILEVPAGTVHCCHLRAIQQGPDPKMFLLTFSPAHRNWRGTAYNSKLFFFWMWRNVGIQNVITWPWTSVLTFQNISTATPWFPLWKENLAEENLWMRSWNPWF